MSCAFALTTSEPEFNLLTQNKTQMSHLHCYFNQTYQDEDHVAFPFFFFQ